MFKPTVGGIVWFKAMTGHTHAAIICHVHSTHEVNLCVFHSDGTTFARHHVTLAHDRAAKPLECESLPHEFEEERVGETHYNFAGEQIHMDTTSAEAKAEPKPRAATARATSRKDNQ